LEKVVAELLARSGFDVEVTQRSRDGGRDILAWDSSPRRLYVVECKRYGHDRPVRVAAVRALYGVATAEGAAGALLVTTSRFTRDAETFRDRVSYMLDLAAFDQLVRWIKHATT
jgi:HJR/Mrr/RecB family endonuclease